MDESIILLRATEDAVADTEILRQLAHRQAALCALLDEHAVSTQYRFLQALHTTVVQYEAGVRAPASHLWESIEEEVNRAGGKLVLRLGFSVAQRRLPTWVPGWLKTMINQDWVVFVCVPKQLADQLRVNDYTRIYIDADLSLADGSEKLFQQLEDGILRGQ